MSTPELKKTMDSLVGQQESLGLDISNSLRNWQKDGSARKNETYIQTRLTLLENKWEDVQRNHVLIQQIDDPENPYHTTDYFHQIELKYEAAKKYLLSLQSAFSDLAAKDASNKEKVEPVSEDSAQRNRLRQQYFYMNEVSIILNQIKLELLENKSKTRYEILLQKLNKHWDAIISLNMEIQINEQEFKDKYFTSNMYRNMQEKVDDSFEKLEILLTQTKPNINLPQIQLPTFQGNYKDWVTFEDMFIKVIDSNTMLSDIEKMQYLKTYTRGEAARIIQHLHISSNNYRSAWSLLERRYQNHRLLVSNLIDKILDFPDISTESHNQLKQMYDVITECLEAINNVGVDTSYWGPIVGRLITRKWDPETNRQYEQSLLNSHEIQELSTILSFLERRFQSLESLPSKTTSNIQQFQSFPNTINKCSYCNGFHNIYNCLKFKSLSIPDRIQFVKSKQLCINCLRHNFKEPCHSQSRCRTCNLNHHSFLHIDKSSQQFIKANNDTRRKSSTATHAASVRTESNTQENIAVESLLATALVSVADQFGNRHQMRVLLDQGSQSSFITEEAAQILALPKQPIRAEISGLGDEQPKLAKSRVHALLYPRFSSEFFLCSDLIVMSKLTKLMPKAPLPNINFELWNNLILADPNFHIPGPIDILLGVNEFGNIIQEGLVKSEAGLISQQTKLGWIVSGKLNGNHTNNLIVNSMISRTEEQSQLSRFWELEDVINEPILSADDYNCEELYKKTTVRNKDGSYTVRIPFKSDNVELGHSKQKAVARFLQLERKFQFDKQLYSDYKNFMDDYIALGHMRKIKKPDENSGNYYIPHHPVIRESSSTTKLRVVFDASSKTSNNVSLNDIMFVGPKLQQDLSEVLLRWRVHQIVFTADIEKMYRQIKIHPNDQDYQRIVWRNSNSEELCEYSLTTVTYGTASAPYLAMRTLNQLAYDEHKHYPRASEVVKRDFYVDDLMSGTNDLHDAINIQQQLIELLERGGFNLRKWSSNNVELLSRLPEDKQDQSVMILSPAEYKKSLGILWNPINDTFSFSLKITSPSKITKRFILAEISKIFDPLGWLSPVIITMKLLIQELWIEGKGWDDEVTPSQQKRWSTFCNQSSELANLRIPRWLKSQTASFEIHGFCDASEKAYGAVIYSRIVYDGQVHINLMHSKSKVAPKKQKITLPRLELCAAVLLAKLIDKTNKALNTKFKTFAWTDSMITLGWIRGEICKWPTFVANRVAEITRITQREDWNHVPSSDNPADLISRGVEPSKIQENQLWWNGPSWLPVQEAWPAYTPTPTANEEIHAMHVATSSTETQIIERFSSLNRLLRVITYCKRFISIYLKKEKPNSSYLQIAEIQDTLRGIILKVQSTNFHGEITSLKNKHTLPSSSNLRTLCPFLDDHGILRVGGRLNNSNLSYDEKHPIILPYKHHFSKLIIQNAHIVNLHSGTEATQAYIRQKYWIINGKRAIKFQIRSCTRCIRYKAETMHQLMGQLPAARVTPSAPFSHCGVDYAGPIQIRTSKGRGHKAYKGYLAIFVCFATKAIHIEVVSDLTSSSFLAAFQRFIARRGNCLHIYSDNGTNFVGSAKQISKEISNLLKNQQLQSQITTLGTQWHFIPPAAPHFGGLWEAGVKSIKHHLRRVIGESTLTFEELTTLMYQIEACLNSRPLCQQDNDPDNISVLTPGHFLIGRQLVSPPSLIDPDVCLSYNQRWKLVQRMKKDFWSSWSKEYLQRLQQRNKWHTAFPNVDRGAIVLIKEENISPSKWPLARVKEIHPDKEGINRVATLERPGNTTTKRPIHKLILIPTDSETQSNLPGPTNTQRKPTMSLFTFFMIFMSLLCISSANYTLRTPHKGLYLEHLGPMMNERGIFRLQVDFPLVQFSKNLLTANNVTNQFLVACNKTERMVDDIQCESLYHHLQERISTLSKTNTTIYSIKTRSKRGLLGKFLTAVFGVNDEVYHDIDTLNSNQEKLIQLTTKQSKVMLSTIINLNETEQRLNNQLARFTVKFNKALSAVNQMQRWFNKINGNTLNIHLMGMYQVAINYIDDLIQFHNLFSTLHYDDGSMYKLISPVEIQQLMDTINKKLPRELYVLSKPLVRTELSRNSTHLSVFGYFYIVSTSTYELIHIAPTPLKIENNFFWTVAIPNQLFAIDHNNQRYCTLSTSEFQSCTILANSHYICRISVESTFDSQENCAISEVVRQSESAVPGCTISKHAIKNTIWIQLFIPNTWLFITTKPITVGVYCNGDREDVFLNGTKIVQLTQNCHIRTPYNTIYPVRVESTIVQSSYSRSINYTHFNNYNETLLSDIAYEQVYKSSESIQRIYQQEQELQEDINQTLWKKVAVHSSLATFLWFIVYGLIGVSVVYIIRWIRVSRRPASSQPAPMELRPLR